MSEYRRRSAIRLSAFWLRRARRLLPALVIVLVAVTLMVRFAEPAGLYPDFRMSALSALFYFSNWWQIAASGNYFVATGAVSPLTHTWSLAVEEQFYLVWPLVVLGVMHLARGYVRGVRILLGLSVVGAVASAVEMALLYNPLANTTRLYFGTDTHAQSILVGSAMACALTMIERRRGTEGMAPRARSLGARRLLVLAGLAGLAGTALLSSLVDGTSWFDYQGGFFLSALSSAAVIVAAVTVPTGVIARFLSLRPLIWLGTISYGAYLWHFPVFVYLDAARTGQTGFVLLLVRFATTFALAEASFSLVERRVMYGTFWRSLKALAPTAVTITATVAVIIAGTVVPATALPATSRSGTSRSGPVNGMSGTERRALTAAHAFTGHPVRFLLLGDSLAASLDFGLKQQSVRRFGVQIIDKSDLGCDLDDLPAIVDGNLDQPESPCRTWRTLWRGEVARYRPDVVGLLVGRWDITDHVDNGRVVHIGQPAWDAHLSAEIDQAVSILSDAGAKVVLFTMPDIDPPESANGVHYPENGPTRVSEFNRILTDVAKKRGTVATVVDLQRQLDPQGTFHAVIDGIAVRWADGIHISEPGGIWLQPFILPTVAELGLTARMNRGVR